MKRTYLFILGICLFLTLSGKSNYIFETISPPYGFAFSAITSITEDDHGFIWFSTSRLYYYNNYETKEYSLFPDSLSGRTTTINDIYHDAHSNLWVCADEGLFLFNEVADEFVKQDLVFDHAPPSPITFESILFLKEDKYIISINQRIFLYNKTRGSLVKFRPNASFDTELENVSTMSLYNQENVMVGTHDGRVFLWNINMSQFVYLYQSEPFKVNAISFINNHYYIGFDGNGVEVVDLKGNMVNEYRHSLEGKNYLPDDRVRQIIERKNDIWIGTYGGLLILNSLSSEIVLPNKINGLPHQSIYVLHKNKHDGVWIGTWAGGLVHYNDFNYRFLHINSTHPGSDENNSVVCSFAEDKWGHIWVGNEQQGISIFDESRVNFINNPINAELAELKQVKSLASANGNEIWIGTFMRGLWKYTISTNTLQQVGSDLLGNSIIPHIFARDEKLYICTRRSGLFIYDTRKDQFKQVSISTDYKANWIWKVHLEHQNVWLCTDLGVYKYDLDTDSIEKQSIEDMEGESANFIVFSAVGESSNELWVGCEQNGLCKYYPERNQIQKVHINETIDYSDIYSIIQDQSHRLWFSTNHGIHSYDAINNEARQFSTIDGISGELFIPNAIFQSSSGLLYFGSPNGFNIVDPIMVKNNKIIPKVYPSVIKVNNIHFKSIDDLESNSRHLASVKNISLKHDQNSLAFRFVSNNFIKPEKNKYRFRLINYQDDWVEVGLDQEITFTQVPPGTYTLEVFGSNNDNVWSKEPLHIHININPPFWRTLYAYMVYFLLFITLAFLVIKQVAFRVETRKLILDETYSREANEIISSEKQKFFTNISHEIRTPLTLILSPLQNLMKRYKYDESTLNQLNIIDRNANRLLKLTNQILDVRLIEVGKLKARFERTDIVEICKEVMDYFELQIIEKGVNFIFRSSFKSFMVTADPDLIEKIIYNLVSNALKYSREKGQIILSIETKELVQDNYQQAYWTGNDFVGNSLEVRVKDVGIGIKEEKIPSLFERFSVDPDNEHAGTGIGLNLCQEYAILNNSNLFVTSKEGDGSEFILNIPVGEKNEYKKETSIIQPYFDQGVKDLSIPEDPKPDPGNRSIILLVEDNDDLRVYLKDSLNIRYKVLSAKNGTQALEIAQEVVPDVIITDILMPEMGGLELLSSIKDNMATRHIPVIVLTALTETSHHIESISRGADSYLIKPIDESVLIAHIESTLLKKKHLSEMPDQVQEKKANRKQAVTETFMEAAERVIEENLQTAKFGTQEMAEELQISRSTLYRKIKLATNQNLTEFIRNKRLSHATKLIKAGKYNMNEIGYYVGFNSDSYFNRSFKKKYGMTPREYAKKTGSFDESHK